MACARIPKNRDASEQVARDAGVDGYFLKPVPIARLAAAIRALCDAA